MGNLARQPSVEKARPPLVLEFLWPLFCVLVLLAALLVVHLKLPFAPGYVLDGNEASEAYHSLCEGNCSPFMPLSELSSGQTSRSGCTVATAGDIIAALKGPLFQTCVDMMSNASHGELWCVGLHASEATTAGVCYSVDDWAGVMSSNFLIVFYSLLGSAVFGALMLLGSLVRCRTHRRWWRLRMEHPLAAGYVTDRDNRAKFWCGPFAATQVFLTISVFFILIQLWFVALRLGKSWSNGVSY